ncbi:MAG: hypothetical protein IJD70_08640 [Clostridia bacterium]|nr:hypothetical protein [Clostridia bacterium]
MIFSLPKEGQRALDLLHFPTKHQAFIFRAYEYVPMSRIAKILGTTEENVIRAADEMGLPDYAPGNIWLERGYITIIRRMWHILPYPQLLELLGMTEGELALILKEEDFLAEKLREKPVCEPVYWRELTDEERAQTAKIKAIMQSVAVSGKKPFEFEYSVPKINRDGKEVFKTRMIYAFSGLYQHAFDLPSEVYLPSSQLEAYRDLGVNGIWTQAVLSGLVEFPFEPSISEGHKERLARMKEMTERLDRYGIKLYLYINEPRYMPLSFFEKYPDLCGHVRGDGASLCTSTEAVRGYIRDSIEKICREVPLIGGFFTITRSENLTNCYSHSGDGNTVCSCPRCSERSAPEVISELINTIAEGAHRVSNEIKIFAWSWAWRGFSEEIIRRLDKSVILLSQSELEVPFEIGGVCGRVLDYSISIPGPGEKARGEWAIAKECGLEIGAKVQISTTWEASTIPAIPVSPLIDDHIRALRDEGVEHLLLSWTLGGYPGNNVATAAKYFYEHSDEISTAHEAEKLFSEAFREFPFHIQTLYKGPQNAGPSSLLFPEPSGYPATMTGFAYDDLKAWRSIYPVDIFEDQFRKLCEGWEKGLSLIDKNNDSEVAVMARAAYCIFRSSLDQIRFIRARDEKRYSDCIVLAESEENTARIMLAQMNKNAAIGYEAANHYYFSRGQIVEKILNCRYVAEYFKEKVNQNEA